MQETVTIDRLAEAQGQTVYSADGEKLGTVNEIFYDQETRRPEWISVATGFLGRKTALVPVQGADLREDGLRVRFTKDDVQGAPEVDTSGEEISQESESTLYSHYGLSYSEQRSESGLPEGTGVGGGGTVEGDTVTRAEEELRVGKRETEAGRARLRKWVETEPVSADVELKRETARVTREPVDQPASGAEFGEQEVDVPLREEQPVDQKETVDKERIGLEKDVETERQTVGDEVRKERVEVEGDVKRKRKRK